MARSERKQLGKFYVTEKDNVKCKICKKEFKAITDRHLMTQHNMTTKEYDKKYPYTQRYSLNTLNKLHNIGVERMKKPTVKQKQAIKNAKDIHFKKADKSKKRQGTSSLLKEKVKRGKWINPALNKEAKEKIKKAAKRRDNTKVGFMPDLLKNKKKYMDNLKVVMYKKTIIRHNLNLDRIILMIDSGYSNGEIERHHQIKRRALRYFLSFLRDKNNKHLIRKLKRR